MSQQPVELTELFTKINILVRKHVKKMISHEMLLEADGSGADTKEKLLQHIIVVTATEYGISRDKLKNGRGNHHVSRARKMCLILIQEHLGMNEAQAAAIFKIDRAVVYRANDEHASMDSKIAWQRQHLENHSNLSRQVNEYKKKLVKSK